LQLQRAHSLLVPAQKSGDFFKLDRKQLGSVKRFNLLVCGFRWAWGDLSR